MSTQEEIRHEFEIHGISISEWARSNGFSTALVYQVLSGKRKALRGQSHQIAVLLGMKEGVIGGLKSLTFNKVKT